MNDSSKQASVEHTPEPWAHRNGRIYQADRDVLTIANIARASDGDYSEANARRIVACVNACAGVPTELLEEYPAPFSEMRAQRDQLLAALERMVAIHDEPSGFAGKYGKALDAAIDAQAVKIDAALESARAAIAAVKGGAA